MKRKIKTTDDMLAFRHREIFEYDPNCGSISGRIPQETIDSFKRDAFAFQDNPYKEVTTDKELADSIPQMFDYVDKHPFTAMGISEVLGKIKRDVFFEDIMKSRFNL